MEDKNKDIRHYTDFVEQVTSKESKDLSLFIERLTQLANNSSVNVPLLITGAMGLGSESGEFEEIVKKILFQGKPLDDGNIYHMKRELGDIMFYWMDSCVALGLDPYDVIAENRQKLEARYPGGVFDVARSEVRKANDI